MQRVQYDTYEYRRGKRLETWFISNPVFDLTINETTEAIRVNGITFSRKHLASCWGSRARNFAAFADLLCIAYETAVTGKLADDAPDWAKYMRTKLQKLFANLKVNSTSMDAKLTMTMMPWTREFADPTMEAKIMIAKGDDEPRPSLH